MVNFTISEYPSNDQNDVFGNMDSEICLAFTCNEKHGFIQYHIPVILFSSCGQMIFINLLRLVY